VGRKLNPPITSTAYVTPSEMLHAKLNELNMTQVDLARRAKVSKKHINDIYRGHARIGYDLSLALEMILGVPARDWNEAQTRFDLDEAMNKSKTYRMKNIRKTEPTEVTYVFDKNNRVIKIYLQMFYRTVFQARKLGRYKYIIATIPIFSPSNSVIVKNIADVHRHMNQYVKWLGGYTQIKVMDAIRKYDDGEITSPFLDGDNNKPGSDSDSHM